MAEQKRVVFRGVSMVEGWPEKIKAAQELPAYTSNGRSVSRIRYGDEQDDWDADKQPCHDCAVFKGEFHVPGCDVEECPACGGQLISCDCEFDGEEDAPN